MTLAMCAYIEFPATERRAVIALRKVSEIRVTTNVHDVCQAAVITLPRSIPEFTNQDLRDTIRRGDPVRITMGYDGNLSEMDFAGFVSRVGADVPVVIDCRDGLWKLLQEPFNKAYKAAHVPTVVNDLVGGQYKVEAIDAVIGPIRIERAKKADAFKLLKDEFGLITYLKGDTVYCGVLFDAKARTVVYDMSRNVKSSELKYRVADDVALKVTAKSIQRDGSEPLEVTVGDPEGEERTLTYYGITDKAELTKLAEVDLEKYAYDGYEGGFKAFGIPFCQFGDRIDLRSSEYPERDGSYVAEAVEVTYSPSGLERSIKLAQRWIA